MKRWAIAVVAAWTLAGCGGGPARDPVLGEAFVGPATLQVRDELAARAALVATLKHGDRVDLIGRRRRFYRIRTSSGAEGWVDGRQLLSPGGMTALRELADKARNAPSQGQATVFETLNVHTLPNRQSPSFFQITPDAKADVIAHERIPRAPFEAPEFIANPSASPVRKSRSKKEPAVPPPPPPKPPAVPADWLAISGHADGIIPAPAIPAPKTDPAAPGATEPPAVSMDDWTLIRGKDGRAGWVLTRALLMAVPDEVAQYAERARIAAYFRVGSVMDHGVQKPVWLWATLAARGVEYEFDSLRIFVWSTRRRRYETSFVERNLRGYLPVRSLAGSGQNEVAGFRVMVQEKSGQVVEREYALSSFRARVVSRRPAPPQEVWYTGAAAHKPIPVQESRSDENWSSRAKGLFRELKDRLKR